MRAALNGETSLSLARRMEKDFFDDLRALHVRPPTTYLRVTDHIPEIIAYIQRIIHHGFAYVDNGNTAIIDAYMALYCMDIKMAL